MNHHITAGLMAHSGGIQSRYPATSSAFSASAHPHEDWTKISDLAERRRIQNRIAQRNYRKKLKRRLEDLEAKAASTSASPEQQPASLPQKQLVRRRTSHTCSSSSASTSPKHSAGPSPLLSQRSSQSTMMSPPSTSLFGDEFTKHLTHSPSPALSYPMTTGSSFTFSPFTTAMQYPTTTSSYGPSGYSYDSFPSAYASAPSSYSSKNAFYPDIDMNVFNFQFPPAPNPDADRNSYSTPTPITPPLSDCHDLYVAGSPPESSFLPQTPPTSFDNSPRLTML